MLTLSLGYIHACFLWAHAQISMETHWNFVRTNFSSVLCIDEVHDSGRTILFATYPLGDFTVSFKVVNKNDQAHMDMFLQALKDRGLKAEVSLPMGRLFTKTVCNATGLRLSINCASFTSSKMSTS